MTWATAWPTASRSAWRPATEWRTPPLWGIGLTKTVSGHTFFLHDGRARNLTEAILWHGGEADKSPRRICIPAERRQASPDHLSGVPLMRHWKFLACRPPALAQRPCPALAQQAAPADTLNEAAVPMSCSKAVDDVIRPGYRNMHAVGVRELTSAMKDLCERALGRHARAMAKAAFADTITALVDDRDRPDRPGARQEPLRAHPVLSRSQGHRPEAGAGADRQGRRQGRDRRGRSSTKSVALQSLTALEYVLYGNGAETLATDKNGFRCRYGAAIAGNIGRSPARFQPNGTSPNGIQKAWKNTRQGQRRFRWTTRRRSPRCSAFSSTALRTSATSVWRASTRATSTRRGRKWRSTGAPAIPGTSMTANLEGLQALWQKAGMADLLPAGQARYRRQDRHDF